MMDKQDNSRGPQDSPINDLNESGEEEHQNPTDISEYTEEDYQLLQFYEEVVQFESVVNNNIQRIKDVCTDVTKNTEQPSTSEPTNTLRVGPAQAVLLTQIKKTAEETIPLLNGIIGGIFDLEQEIPVDSLEHTLNECEILKRKNIEINQIFARLSSALKRLGIHKEGTEADSTPESIDSLFAFSDFLGENPQVATSSPFPDVAKCV